MNILAHTSFIGTTGYNNHAQSFFTELNKLCNVKIRNFTVGEKWKGLNDTPHDEEPYLTEEHKKMLYQQVLFDKDHKRHDYPIYSYNAKFTIDKHIVLNETDHYMFYDNYKGYKIAYNVWESTLYPEQYFNKLLEYDEFWVPSKWQKECAIKQGYPAHKIKIIREGVDRNTFFPIEQNKKDKFQFLLNGRWDYRKSTKEIIQSWLNVFKDNDKVELLLLVDNPYSIDGLNNTEERLEKFNLLSNNIKILHFLSREDYIKVLKNTDVFLSCARSEGWGLPLCESIASGIPSIYSNWGAQLEYMDGKGIPVDIIGELPANIAIDSFNSNVLGNYCEPNFKDLEIKILDSYINYKEHKIKALSDSIDIRNDFNWENAAKKAYEELIKNNVVENEICIIPAYPDTIDKRKLLIDNINQLKSFGYKILLSSHYNIDNDIISMVDYYVYDSEDWLIKKEDFDKYNIFFESWIIPNDNKCKIHHCFPYHHSYAVYKLFKNAVFYTRALGIYNKLHFIDYDCFIGEKSFLENHSKMLNERDAIFYDFGEKSFFAILFSLNLNVALKIFSNFNNISEYLNNSIKNSILEYVIYELTNNLKIEYYILPREKLTEGGNKMDQNTMISSVNFDLLGNAITEFSFNIVRYNDKCILYLREKLSNAKYKIKIDNKIAEFTSIVNETFLILLEKKNNYNISIFRDDILFLRKEYLFNDAHFKQNYIEIFDESILLLPYDDNTLTIKINYIDGCFVELTGNKNDDIKYLVSIINNGIIEHSDIIGSNCWVKANKSFYINWQIQIKNINTNTIIYDNIIDLTNLRVLISFDSKSLGDTIAWFPAVEEFRKKHNCKVICSTFWNKLFINNYPDIDFVNPGTIVDNISAAYRIGWVYSGNVLNPYYHPCEVKDKPLQKTAFDILGLEYKEIKPLINLTNHQKKKQIAIAIHSTAQAKYWNNPNGWQEVVDYCKKIGYDVILLSKEENGYMGNYHPNGIIQLPPGDIDNVIKSIEESELFIGISSGISWLAWCTNTPTIVISGFTEKYTEPATIRIGAAGSMCSGCINKLKLDAGDWNWCPFNKEFECSKSITSEEVIDGINKLFCDQYRNS